MNLKNTLHLLAILVSFQPKLLGNHYERVVSLAPSITKNIYYLNAQDQLAGCTSYCTPAKDQGKTVVASPMSTNIEKVLSLKPDLVIATTITNPDDIGMLRNFNLKVVVFPTPKSFDEICSQFIETGQLLGKEAFANEMVSAVCHQIDSLKELGKKAEPGKIFFQIGAEPLFTVIPNTFMNDYITFANGANIAAGLNKGLVSREKVIGEEEKKIWESYEGLDAVKNNHIYIVDSDMACTPTPQTFLQTLEYLFLCLKI